MLQADNSDKKDLAYNLTVSLMNSSILACIDAEGYSIAFRALAPCIKLNADWCLSNSMRFIGRDPQGIDGFLEMMNWTMNMSNRGKATYRYNPEGNLIIELKNCRTCGAFPMMCQWWCQYEFSTMCEDSNPDLIMSLDQSMSRGDSLCQWSIKRKDGKRLTEGETKDKELVHKCLTLEPLDFWAQAGPAEFMTLSTACLVERVGRDKAMKLLTRRAMENGMAFGAYYLLSYSQCQKSDVFSALELFNSLMNVEATTNRITDRSWEAEIKSCPFSGVPPEICAQIEDLKKGAIGVLLRDQDWNYTERCMEGGFCKQRLTINNKIESGRENEESKSFLNELKSILKARLAKGEITEALYDRLLEKIMNEG